MSSARSSPFSPRVALGLVLVGALGFMALLWAIGSGLADPAPQPSGAHVGGKGLTGFAALAGYLRARDYAVTEVRTRGPHRRGGLLVLTPRHNTKPADLARVIADHASVGPTLLIMPKWLAQPLPLPGRLGTVPGNPKVRPGFVKLEKPLAVEWRGFHDEVSVDLSPLSGSGAALQWRAAGLGGVMPAPTAVVSGKGTALVPLVTAGADARMLAGYFADGGHYRGLRVIALADEPPADDATGNSENGENSDQASPPSSDVAQETAQFPLIVVFDPDLLNNYGLAHQENALLAERLVQAAHAGGERKVVFDLTLAGYARSQSLLDLAFTPPFVAATLCLLLAAGVALWRAYHRFGPPILITRSIAFGKRALIANAAGLLRRARRQHLLGGPYADAVRERLVKALALPQRLDSGQAEAAIDRALAVRTRAAEPAAGTGVDPNAETFSASSARLRGARKPRDMLRAAQRLSPLERTLLR